MKRKSTLIFILGLLVISIPTFVRMLRPGLYSMQDFPYFRVVEYAKCFTDFQIPCRWAPDAGAGFGEPVFNFYSHTPFFLGALVSKIGFSFEFSVKAIFAMSLVGSAISMFFLAKKIWKNNWAAIFCSILYLYAPYRAVNVWVRGALPEAFAFVIVPLILLAFEIFLEKKTKTTLVYFATTLSLLVITHNLSVLLYAHLIGSWIIVRLFQTKNLKLSKALFFALMLAAGLSAFYLLPTIFESKFVTINSTTQGYFDFRAHFVTIPQLFISRFWGYGGSTWGDQDGLSLSIGQVQWIIATSVLLVDGWLFVTKKLKNTWGYLPFHLVLTGFFYLFLTHNKSAFLWESFSSVASFIQFPWRFLGPALFSFALAGGFLIVQLPKLKYLTFLLAAIVILFNLPFFREDIWFDKPDQYFLTGDTWKISQIASIGDYWTTEGPTANGNEKFLVKLISKTSTQQIFSYQTENLKSLSFPIMYFPGWKAQIEGNSLAVSHDTSGFVSVAPNKLSGVVEFDFINTPIRSYGNTITILSLIIFLCIIKYDRFTQNTNKK